MQIDFFPIDVNSITAKFDCPECGEKIISERIGVPSPNIMAEKASDSYEWNDGHAICENCEKEFEINVWAGWHAGYIEIEDLEEEYPVEIEEDVNYEDYVEAILDNTEFYENFNDEVENIGRLNKVPFIDDGMRNMQKRLLYVSIINCLETYLSDAFINTVLGDEEYIQKFIKTFKDYKNQKFPLKEIYEYMGKIKEIATKSMADVIYHDLAKVKGMYKDTLEIEFPEIAEPSKAVKKRHDLVHRNGKTKEGEEIVITENDVSELIETVKSFVEEIENQVIEK